jgi:hypothetical protein
VYYTASAFLRLLFLRHYMCSIAVDRVMASRELSCQDVHIVPWSSEVLPSVNKPLNSGDDYDDAKGSDAVV